MSRQLFCARRLFDARQLGTALRCRQVGQVAGAQRARLVGGNLATGLAGCLGGIGLSAGASSHGWLSIRLAFARSNPTPGSGGKLHAISGCVPFPVLPERRTRDLGAIIPRALHLPVCPSAATPAHGYSPSPPVFGAVPTVDSAPGSRKIRFHPIDNSAILSSLVVPSKFSPDSWGPVLRQTAVSALSLYVAADFFQCIPHTSKEMIHGS